MFSQRCGIYAKMWDFPHDCGTVDAYAAAILFRLIPKPGELRTLPSGSFSQADVELLWHLISNNNSSPHGSLQVPIPLPSQHLLLLFPESCPHYFSQYHDMSYSFSKLMKQRHMFPCLFKLLSTSCPRWNIPSMVPVPFLDPILHQSHKSGPKKRPYSKYNTSYSSK